MEAASLLSQTLHDAERLLRGGDQRPGILREIAAIHAALDDPDKAREWLARAIDDGWRLEGLITSHLVDPIRAVPRFRMLMERMQYEVHLSKEQFARDPSFGR